jgi:hypothetical protein
VLLTGDCSNLPQNSLQFFSVGAGCVCGIAGVVYTATTGYIEVAIMLRIESATERQVVMESKKCVSEYKTRIIGTTAYNVGIVYNEKGEPLNKLLLQLMKEKQQHAKL